MSTIDADQAVAHLTASDPRLAGVIVRVGPFAGWPEPEDPFSSLLRAVVFQQLSGKAASTIHRRFLQSFPQPAEDALRVPDPAEVLALDEEQFRAAGLSRQKTLSIRDLALHAASGELDGAAIEAMSDEDAIATLTRVRGVGRWTAEMYLMFHLGRPDVLPTGDLGINRAIQLLYDLPALPKPPEVLRIGEPWRPWATVACWYLWRSEDVKLAVPQ
ncbi:MAG: DNA-3-methyladenine glycosylase, partial [Dehalococcoidia bacterium]